MDARYMSRDSEVMSGALCFKGTRVPVQNLFDYLEGTSSLEEFLQDFPLCLEKLLWPLSRTQRVGCFQMRWLLDESVPVRLRWSLPSRSIKTVVEMG